MGNLGRRGARAATQLAARSLVMRVVALTGTLVLVRLLVPEDFGVFGIVSFVVAAGVAVGDFGLGGALVQQYEEPTHNRSQPPGQLNRRSLW